MLARSLTLALAALALAPLTAHADDSPACPALRDRDTVQAVISSPAGERLRAHLSPRTVDALRGAGVRVSLPHGCERSHPVWGEDGEPDEVYDRATGWEIAASAPVKARLVALSIAETRDTADRRATVIRALTDTCWVESDDDTDRTYCMPYEGTIVRVRAQ